MGLYSFDVVFFEEEQRIIYEAGVVFDGAVFDEGTDNLSLKFNHYDVQGRTGTKICDGQNSTLGRHITPGRSSKLCYHKC